jgi:DNA polymerase-3 subunit delta
MSVVVPVRLLKGGDPILVGEAVTGAIDEAVGDADRSLVVDEFDLDVHSLAAAVDAAQTSPFLTDHRVVVVRRFGRYSKNEDIAVLLSYLQDPSPTTALILAWEKTNLKTQVEGAEPFTASPRMPTNLTKAVTGCGGVVIDTDPTARNMSGWVADQLEAAGLDVEPRARDAMVKVIGEDGGAVREIIGRLTGTYGTGTRLRYEDVEPYLGQAGGVAPWDLTDAIDAGDVPKALDMLARMLGAGDRHALAIMASLQTHYLRMARLDGANPRSEKDAATILGMKGSTFPAKKAMANARRLGSAKVRRAVALVAAADHDLRGGRAWPDELVMEVLVARLARLSR